MEAEGLTKEIIAQLQDKATVLTQERKRRGKTVPEGLAVADSIKNYKTIASHPVSKNLFTIKSESDS
jgi:pre-mRNA-processing factor 19